MKKFLIAPLLTVIMVLSVIGIGLTMKPEPVKAEPVAASSACDTSLLGLVCARQVGQQIIISVAGSDVASLPLSNVVKVPTVTVALPSTIRVTLPRVTVTRPPVTVTLPRVTVVRPQATVTLPGVTLPRQTVTLRLPGATTTVTLAGQPGSVRTVTSTEVDVRPQTVPVTVTGSNGQTIQTSVTITPSPEPGAVITKKTPGPERRVSVSVPTFVGLSIGLLLLGLVLGLLAIYLAYAAGFKDSEAAEKVSWNKFRDDLFGKK